ncbi:hypothetical protein [Psychromonas sp. Urea-02u-13]|uniref:hypothetical protein n=1 Tax=Psychromonas sp. Urea-02u-13 TaxID=2058326 RepID=UPI000C32D6F4|nr:hypothetical protein [Psychromonas sp. Urea-02u-13]PKG37187.1 hypothetical protein CXF74_20165 [Psychromonas sp. Urea-02u-13]
MKISLLFLLLLTCISCSDEAEFYSVESFNDSFTNGLFISKLMNNNIPYQYDYQMGEDYVLVHFSFKESLIQLRKDSLKEAKSLSLINLENECSQQNLSQKFKESNVFHMTLNKRSIPMIRVTNKDHSSQKVSAILNAYDWRCD